MDTHSLEQGTLEGIRVDFVKLHSQRNPHEKNIKKEMFLVSLIISSLVSLIISSFILSEAGVVVH